MKFTVRYVSCSDVLPHKDAVPTTAEDTYDTTPQWSMEIDSMEKLEELSSNVDNHRLIVDLVNKIIHIYDGWAE